MTHSKEALEKFKACPDCAGLSQSMDSMDSFEELVHGFLSYTLNAKTLNIETSSGCAELRVHEPLKLFGRVRAQGGCMSRFQVSSVGLGVQSLKIQKLLKPQP